MTQSNQSTSSHRSGFSLVEMAVVIASVAAIVVLTTTGINIVSQTHLNRITQDVNHFTAAMESFESIYDALPGDISDTGALPSSEAATGGNGDGTINTSSEALNFWRHLSRTGLLSGDYDGSSTYVPGTGVPAGSSTSSGYNVFNPTTNTSDDLHDQAIIFEFASFSSSSNQLPTVRPADARSIDKQGDDGNPSTGLIRGMGTDCIDNQGTASNLEDDEYNVDNESIKCRLLFIVRQPAVTTVASDVSGDCVEVGSSRESATSVCPAGTEGSIIERCTATGNWVVVQNDCEAISCSGAQTIGSTRTLSCLGGQTGHILQECIDPGIWKDVENTCTTPSDSVTCTTNNSAGDIQRLPCPRGQRGYIEQDCASGSGKWTTNSDGSCVAITCGSSALNAIRTSGTSKNCNDNSAKYSTSGSSAVHEKCSLDGNWHVVHNTCLPQFGSCNAASDSTRDIKCPPGETGKHIQVCVDNGSADYWVTKRDNCIPVRCGSHSLGYQRTSKVSCPRGSAGVMTEICGTSYNSSKGKWEGKWYTTDNMCAIER